MKFACETELEIVLFCCPVMRNYKQKQTKKASLSWVTNSWKNSCMKNINSQSEVQSLDEISAKRFQPHSTVGGDSFSKFLFS